MKRKLYDIGSGIVCMITGVMMLGLMLWMVYEANDLSSAVIIAGAMIAMVLREAYHQWRIDNVRRRHR